MRQRSSRSDEVLFISGLAAVLVGIALLLVTTRAFTGALRAWPLLVIAVGGTLLYLALVRRSSPSFLFGGIAFTLEGAFFLVASLCRLHITRAWPLAMVVGGAAGIAAGLVAWRRPRPSFLVPSICFIFLGSVFSLFSFGVVREPFSHFLATWWPSLLILGGILLFAAYGLQVRSEGRGARGRDAGERSSPRDQEREP